MKNILAIFLAISFGLTQIQLAQAQAWSRYSNPRFGTLVDVPANGFIADPAPTNGGGQSWRASDGNGLISVYGTFIVVAETFKGYRNYSLQAAREDGVDITYSAGKRGWFAYSGYRGSDIVYMKVVLTRNCSSLIANHIYLQYPAAQRKRYDSIVKRMAKTLRGSRSGVECN